MSDEPLTNAAVEWLRAMFDATTERPRDPVHYLSDDFFFEDRQTGPVNYGRVDAAGWLDFVVTAWDAGGRQVRWSITKVIAVRGQRSAAMVLRLDYGNGTYSDSIQCFQMDPTLHRMHRFVGFDLEAVDAAIAELDRMHAEIND
jgi:hypothetical protein